MQFGKLRVNRTAGTRNIGIARSVRLKRRTAQTAARSARHGGRHHTRQALLESNCRRRLSGSSARPSTPELSICLQSVEWGRSWSRKREGSEIERDVERSPARAARAKLATQATAAACDDERPNLPGRTNRRTRHGEALYAAYATDREGRLWTYLPWGPYSGPKELCARIDAVRASGVRPEYALIDLASGKPFGQA